MIGYTSNGQATSTQNTPSVGLKISILVSQISSTCYSDIRVTPNTINNDSLITIRTATSTIIDTSIPQWLINNTFLTQPPSWYVACFFLYVKTLKNVCIFTLGLYQ